MDFTLFQNYLDSPAVSSICSYGSENNLAATTSVELSSSYDVITATAASSAQPSTTTTSIYCQQNQYQPQQQYQQQLQYDPMMTRRSPSGSYNTRLSQTRRTSSSNDDTTGMETNTRGGSLNSGHLQQTLTDVMNEIERFSEQNGSVNGNIKRKRKDMDEMSNVSMDSKVLRMAASPMPSNSSTGHNTSHVGDSEKRSVRQNHSEIEKRRRNKMNNYINQLSNLIPTCASVNRKMDKLTVLRLAVQHLKAVRGSIHAYSQSTSRPSNLNDSDLIRLILKSSKDEAGFLFVVDSARGRILYVSESVAKVLNYTQRDLFGQSLFDVLHPKDIAKVKEQMSSNSVSQHHSRDRPASSTFDGKPNLLKNEAGGSSKINAHKIAASGSGDAEPAPVSALPWLCPGARRSFFCRMKTKPGSFFKEEDSIDQDSCQRRKRVNGDKKYRVIQCTGYLKSWSSSSGLPHSGNDEDPGDQNDPSMSTFGAMDCLVAVGRLQTTIEKPIDDAIARGLEIVPGVEFSARHSIDGMFAFICPKATPILGYLPQELQGSSVYEHILYDDIPGLVEGHRRALKTKEEVKVSAIKFRCKDGRFVSLQSIWKQFQNPWNKEIDFIVAKYKLCNPETSDKVQPLITGQSTFSVASDMNFFTGENESSNLEQPSRPPSRIGKNIQDVVTSHVEASRIGKLIVEEIRNGPSSESSSPLSALLSQNVSPSTLGGLPNNFSNDSGTFLSDSMDSLTCSSSFFRRSTNGNNRPNSYSVMLGFGSNSSGNSRPNQSNFAASSPHSSEDNDEATMAVIMSLLEADGGLGGPVDPSTLPWSGN